MNESGLGIYGTSYKTMIQTTRENTIQDHLYLQTSYHKKKSVRIKTKTVNDSIFNGIRIGTTTLQSHRSRYQSTQQEARQLSSAGYQSHQYKGCKNYKCLKTISDLQEAQEENLQTIRALTQEIEKLKKEIQSNTKMIINEDKLKERLVSATGRVQVQKSLGLFGQSLDNNQIVNFSKTDSIILNRTISQFQKGENINISQLLNNQQNSEQEAIKLLDIYHKSQIQNYTYHSYKGNQNLIPYIKCDKCDSIKNMHIIRLECKHQYHLNCLIEHIRLQLSKQQDSFNIVGTLSCHCKANIHLNFIKIMNQPEFSIIYQILSNFQLFILAKSHYLANNQHQKQIIQKCIKEHCYFIIIGEEDKISYCPLCCEFNLFVKKIIQERESQRKLYE
ncbi:unnamed protein product [Paramecium primaurelia]|uniref:Uncharacterized protein n=1 Tax=Paramecium primaurelia TaxID=5886 RepID=A0A8S1JSN0_PARPR|nr:unnamed protein product [Paramecium primaurelia]